MMYLSRSLTMESISLRSKAGTLLINLNQIVHSNVQLKHDKKNSYLTNYDRVVSYLCS